MKDVSFGQYYPVESFVHRMDPRLKILFLIAFITATFLAGNFYGLGLCALILAAAVLFSKVPVLKVLRSIKAVLFLIVFAAVLNIFFYRGDTVWWEWKIFAVTREGVIFSGFLVLRTALLVMFCSMLTYTTTPVALTDGLESLLTPLKWIRFPVHALALIMELALRFIPTLMEETERIKNAQMARGADFESRNPFKRVAAFIPVLIPLLLSAFRRAEEVGDAMEARCYMAGKKRTKYKKLRFSWRDLIGLSVGAAMIAGVVLMNVFLGGVV